MLVLFQTILLALTVLFIPGCNESTWNDPYPQFDQKDNTLYSVFSERPKHLDPALSYTASESIFIGQIYEPFLQYHYLKRPYELEPLTAQEMPTIEYIDRAGKTIEATPVKNIANTIYRIKIKPNIFYQPHPAFAKQAGSSTYLYHALTTEQLKGLRTLSDFPETSTRELVAQDYVYQIKRLADPALDSPIFGFMENYIEGLSEFNKMIQNVRQRQKKSKTDFLDLRDFDLSGVKAIDKYTVEIKIKGSYPQFTYWLAMPFFVPMPWEAIQFYSQKTLMKKNISLDWYPVGTGPFLLKENNPNLQMILEKNPNFHGESYPVEGEASDQAEGLLQLAGKPLPFLDRVIFVHETEAIPYWNKFLQGYFDQAIVNDNNFDQALRATPAGDLAISNDLKEKGIRLSYSVQPALYYWGFNMLDEKVGGYSEKQKKLRQALSIVVNTEEYINIFFNGNGIAAQGPLPPGIFGAPSELKGANPYLYNIDLSKKTLTRRSIEEAKKLLAQAGYPKGIDPNTKKPLVLYLDTVLSGSSESNADSAWMRKQFKKLGIELVVRATQYNRFQDKVRNGDTQIYYWGWVADYPDPDNFLFLLYGKNGKVKYEGENASNYVNAEFDALFEKMKVIPNSPERAAIIDQMIAIVQEDAPWIWGHHLKSYGLRQSWVGPFKPNAMAHNTMKYVSIDPALRERLRGEWNKPIVWPLLVGFMGFILLCVPAGVVYWKKIYQPNRLKAPKKLKE